MPVYIHVDARRYRDFVKQVPTGNTRDMSAWRKVGIIPDGSKVPTEAILQNMQNAVGILFIYGEEDVKKNEDKTS